MLKSNNYDFGPAAGEEYSDSEYFFQYFKLRKNVRHKYVEHTGYYLFMRGIIT